MRAPAVLVVGGTGILRPVAEALVRRARVTVVTRGSGSIPPGARRLRLDARAPGAAVPGTWDAAIVYAPAVAPAVLRRIARATRGPVVLVLTSAMLREDGGREVRRVVTRTGAVPVVLGWTGPPSAPRWHTPKEIAPAVLTAFAARRPVRLGRLTGDDPA